MAMAGSRGLRHAGISQGDTGVTGRLLRRFPVLALHGRTRNFAAATMDSITGSFPAGLAEMAPACGLVCSMTTCARGTSPLDWANRKNSEL